MLLNRMRREGNIFKNTPREQHTHLVRTASRRLFLVREVPPKYPLVSEALASLHVVHIY